MSKDHFYSVWLIPDARLRRGYIAAYQVVKYNKRSLFESDPYVVALYSRNDWYRCECEGFKRWHKCRHQSIVREFLDKKKVSTGSLYDYDNERWSNQFVATLEEV